MRQAIRQPGGWYNWNRAYSRVQIAGERGDSIVSEAVPRLRHRRRRNAFNEIETGARSTFSREKIRALRFRGGPTGFGFRWWRVDLPSSGLPVRDPADDGGDVGKVRTAYTRRPPRKPLNHGHSVSRLRRTLKNP